MDNSNQQRDAAADAQMLDRAARHIRLKVGDLAAATPVKAQPEAASAPVAPRRPARVPSPVVAGRGR